MASTLGAVNPLRYRGYTYEPESELYYLQSRFYDPSIRRFISPDAFTSTGQGILGNNMLAYCGNNPVNCADPTGQSWVAFIITMALIIAGLSGCSDTESQLPYKSADEAAMAFANSTYSSSVYIRHEYGTVIYSMTSNGTTTYDYATPVAGTPHSVGYSNVVIPDGVTIVATAHTHPNSNVFSGIQTGASSGDIPNAIARGLDSYLVGPNLILQKFSVSSKFISIVGKATPTTLTNQQRETLVAQFWESWNQHLGTCQFGCENMIWPTA